jgi:hypothetical protein
MRNPLRAYYSKLAGLEARENPKPRISHDKIELAITVYLIVRVVWSLL